MNVIFSYVVSSRAAWANKAVSKKKILHIDPMLKFFSFQVIEVFS